MVYLLSTIMEKVSGQISHWWRFFSDASWPNKQSRANAQPYPHPTYNVGNVLYLHNSHKKLLH